MNTFFTALGRHFMYKQAMRVPWPQLVQTLREKHLLPDFVPAIPYVEPEEPEILPVPVAVPVPALSEKEQEEMLALEQRPKSKSKGERALAELPR